MIRTVQVRDFSLPTKPRLFDVIVNEKGRILRYSMKNVKGPVTIEYDEVMRQIRKALHETAV